MKEVDKPLSASDSTSETASQSVCCQDQTHPWSTSTTLLELDPLPSNNFGSSQSPTVLLIITQDALEEATPQSPVIITTGVKLVNASAIPNPTPNPDASRAFEAHEPKITSAKPSSPCLPSLSLLPKISTLLGTRGQGSGNKSMLSIIEPSWDYGFASWVSSGPSTANSKPASPAVSLLKWSRIEVLFGVGEPLGSAFLIQCNDGTWSHVSVGGNPHYGWVQTQSLDREVEEKLEIIFAN